RTRSSSIAPVGQMEVQAPQVMQNSEGSRKGVVTRRRMPRPSKPSAPIFITSSHSRTHMPHRMQPLRPTKVLGTSAGACIGICSTSVQAWQVWQRLLSPRTRSKRQCGTPISRAMLRSTSDSGQRASMSSTRILRIFITRSECVLISIPSATGRVQEVCIRVRPRWLTSTMQNRHEPYGGSDSWEQRVGMSIPAARATSSTVFSFSVVISLPLMTSLTILNPSVAGHRVKLADLVADAALAALFQDDLVRLLLVSLDCARRAVAGTHSAAIALLRVNEVGNERLAHSCRSL